MTVFFGFVLFAANMSLVSPEMIANYHMLVTWSCMILYTQAPPLTHQEIDDLLREARIARICSLNPDGTIHAAPMWFIYEQGQIYCATPLASQKATNIQRNNAVTVLIDSEDPPAKGVIIYGTGKVEELGPGELPWFISLYARYMPQDRAETRATTIFTISTWAKITVNPTRVASYDYAKDTAYASASS
jgi:hypothetical protein